jgi:hypothetical protein
MGVADHELHPGQSAGDQPTQERQPARAVLRAGHVQAEDLLVPVGIDTGRHEGVHVDHPPVLADLDRQRVDHTNVYGRRPAAAAGRR